MNDELFVVVEIIKIPNGDVPNEVHTFNFSLANVDKVNPQEGFDCVQQKHSSSGVLQLSCVGPIKNKIIIRPVRDSSQPTRKCTTQAEEESRNGSTKAIKPSGPFLAKKTQVRKAPQIVTNIAPERKKSTPVKLTNKVLRPQANSAVSHRPYRDRVIHLLALRSYKKPELLSRLQVDGVNQKDKNCLGMILHQVANLNPKDNSYSLKDYLRKEIQKDWPGYSETEKHTVELLLSRKLDSSQNSTSTSVLKSPVTSKITFSQFGNFTDPLNKKQRISRVNSQSHQPVSGRWPASREKAAAASLLPPCDGAAAPTSLHFTVLPASSPVHMAIFNSPSTPERQGTQDLPMNSFSQNSDSISKDQKDKCTSQTPLGTPVPSAVQVTPPKPRAKKRVWTEEVVHKTPKKVKKEESEKDKSKMQDTMSVSKEEKGLGKEETATLKKLSGSDSSEGVKEISTVSTDLPSTSEQPDYFIKYKAIVSLEQCQSYKDDFNAEYDEHQNLHRELESISRKFKDLDAQWRVTSPGSEEYQLLRAEILEEYQKLKQSSPSYHEKKYRYKYLHQKLSHIKSLIGEFDQQQAESSMDQDM
ncbi:RNA polymerase II elongation factor ELL2 [Colius striatus]|uniref:RNA polymerase II elongation factor ELL2 n=1 Tax=Colius striatus TaxID=57412 RepID=UPI002B1D5110|nr:RNA polymerase II elongation factor ELL2 [Colius striatus]